MSTLQGDARAEAALIRTLPLFAGFTAADIERVLAMARRVRAAPGDVIMAEGTTGDGLYIVVSGEIEVRRRDGDADVVLAVRGAGEILGEQSLLSDEPRNATVVALTPCELLIIPPDDFQAMLRDSPHVLRTMLATVTARLRSTQSTLMERDKLAALGTMAAGLAHELNNPAAAAKRAADQLGQAMSEIEQATLSVSMLALTPPQAARLDALTEDVRTCAPTAADPLECSLEEERIGAWLEERGVPQPWEFAAALVAYGWTRARLEALAGDFAESQLGAVAHWLGARLAARALLDEVRTSTEAISALVRAVKGYAYLDRAPVQDVDVVDGLENTLVMLKYKLKHGVEVVRDYDSALPRVEAFGSELNQVWTNLIDNAIDAMGGRGTLTLRTRARENGVTVEIIDSGPGIPPDVLPRIFEPFFTTKPPGVGSGLGLHIAYNLVVNDHRGRVHVDSEPGRTRFCVTLPLRLPRGAGVSRPQR